MAIVELIFASRKWFLISERTIIQSQASVGTHGTENVLFLQQLVLGVRGIYDLQSWEREASMCSL